MKCNPSFFKKKEIPQIDISKEAILSLAKASTEYGFTVTGVQKKLSLHLSDEGSLRLTLVGLPSGYILKPQSDDFENLPEAEDFAMDAAKLLGIKVAEHGLIEVDGEFAYITKRFDRQNNDIYAVEDFCQLSERLTEDKYKASYEKCADIISRYSTLKMFDLSEFFLRLVVCFVLGNSDMHLKTFSLIERTPGKRDFMLSPAYDFLPVNVIMPEDKEETALTFCGKKSNIKKDDFLRLADNIGLSKKVSEDLIKSVVSKEKDIISLCEESFLSDELKKEMISLISIRIDRLR